MSEPQSSSSHADLDRTINYVEFVVQDIDRAKAFYGAVFGWQFTDYGPTYCEFNDGQMKGGFEQGEPIPKGGPLIVLYGDDLALIEHAITAAGGAITKPVFSFPGGERFHFTDPNGCELAVWRHVDASA